MCIQVSKYPSTQVPGYLGTWVLGYLGTYSRTLFYMELFKFKRGVIVLIIITPIEKHTNNTSKYWNIALGIITIHFQHVVRVSGSDYSLLFGLCVLCVHRVSYVKRFESHP